ncbi:hypothetical protein D9V30_04435 [Mycetocola reblochoni]|uniref:Acetyltransferase n=2 Tax=Mycetocola reblochoni TaxID=331618 RepID=A0A1R4JDF6_9MICO|nr:hypothetical protein [Mycetocola reblochoni]RLP69935.1 hypothetical protein D9V30_04435 [Mycetocola reblochoni]SJN30067.1 Acetyltransferase [Mycetocola reblochoni REB411]
MSIDTVRPVSERDFFLWYPLFSRHAGGTDEAPVSDRIAVQLWQWLTTDAEAIQGRLLLGEDGDVRAVAHVRSVPVTTTATRSLVIDDLFAADPSDTAATIALFDAVTTEARDGGYTTVRWQDDVAELGDAGELVEDLWRELPL